MRALKTAFIASILIGTVFLTACPSDTNIARINADPGRYAGREVRIKGRVTNSFGVLGNGAYELDDGTGRLWVATRKGVPANGAQVGATGNIRNGFTFAGRNFGVVMEERDRRTK